MKGEKMKNKEKYFDELMEIIISGCLLAVDKQTNRPEQCYNINRCFGCLFYYAGCNSEEREKWLEEEYQEHITLTDDEKVILKNINKKWKWIARDSGDTLYVYDEKPTRMVTSSEWLNGHGLADISAFKHLFKLIKWEDEPYNIDELLKQNGVER